MRLIPIINKEIKAQLGTIIKTDAKELKERGVFDIYCKSHAVWFDCRIGCLLCYKENNIKDIKCQNIP